MSQSLNFDSIKSVYFLGIGGIGMSAIARFFHQMGKKVSGYDKTATPLTDELQAEGIDIHFEDNPEIITAPFFDPHTTLVVLTPAIPKDHREWEYFKVKGFNIMKRSEVLGVIAARFYTIAVAGTHGKTTTSTLIAHLLRSAGIECTAFLGGISKNYSTNLLIGKEQKGRHIVVVEADEYDRSFLTLFPDVAIITSMDPDHLDIYGTPQEMQDTYRKFAGQVKEDGLLICHKGLPIGSVKAAKVDYALSGPADCYAAKVEIRDHQYHFDWTDGKETYYNLTTQLPGEHNVENAVAAVTAVRFAGLNEEQIREGLSSYVGVKRRFDYQVRSNRYIYIDDYAHHPEELRACIASVRNLYPGRHVTGIFQPHLFTRTRDFVDGFAKSLSMLDRLILLDVYPARELPIPGITSNIILDKVTCQDKQLVPKESVLEFVSGCELDVVLTLGAGDIDQLVDPIRQLLSKN